VSQSFPLQEYLNSKFFPNSATVIPNLFLGLSLASLNMPPEQLDSFMQRMLSSRISRRVLAEHHIALTEAFAGRGGESADGEPHVGIIFTGLNVKRSIDNCTTLLHERWHCIEDLDGLQEMEWPEVFVGGHLGTKFSYIREHLESGFSRSFHGPDVDSLLQVYYF
jgi:pyruvate dehydrogenase kinase 2/3/4